MGSKVRWNFREAFKLANDKALIMIKNGFDLKDYSLLTSMSNLLENLSPTVLLCLIKWCTFL